jgi:alkylated DNA repair dioxygenase AlkB
MTSAPRPSLYGSLPALPRDDPDPGGATAAEPSGRGAVIRPDATFERIDLDGTSWVDVSRGWITDPDALFHNLLDNGAWEQRTLFRYEVRVPEPRLGGRWPTDPDTQAARLELFRALRDRYRVTFDRGGLAQYRDGRDSVAFHRDREMRWLDDTVIAVLSLGAQRPWYLRPRAGRYEDLDEPTRGATHDLNPAGGDLVVLGGRCQADWLHAVPKVSGPIGPRISIQWRWTSRRGRPEEGANFADPRFFSS